ncbi:MAG: NifB/NifX family molybdenum-iron cluster-binding protein [Bacteroidales bacterium]
MRIAISSTGNTVTSKVDSRFGRCAYFAIYDSETGKTEFVNNTAKTAASGAGPAAVQIVAAQNVEKIVSHEFGFKIKSLLNELNIQMIGINDEKTIQDIIDLHK